MNANLLGSHGGSTSSMSTSYMTCESSMQKLRLEALALIEYRTKHPHLASHIELEARSVVAVIRIARHWKRIKQISSPLHLFIHNAHISDGVCHCPIVFADPDEVLLTSRIDSMHLGNVQITLCRIVLINANCFNTQYPHLGGMPKVWQGLGSTVENSWTAASNLDSGRSSRIAPAVRNGLVRREIRGGDVLQLAFERVA